MSKTELEMLREMEPLSVADIERKVGGFSEGFKVVTPCLDNRFVMRYGAKYGVWRYHVGYNEIYLQATFTTRYSARAYVFEEWTKPRRTIYNERCDEYEEE